ncbi:MAG: glutaredoxin [Candidatus Woesearchaeota archaeon]|jgi:glutaredoxin-related protein|nr:glutaredoxin [Candidatus Woesearchaeota archaeon]
MAKIVIYTKIGSSFCEMSKSMFNNLSEVFEEIIVNGKQEVIAELFSRTKSMTFPQIFISGEFIGGYEELRILYDSGELFAKLKK